MTVPSVSNCAAPTTSPPASATNAITPGAENAAATALAVHDGQPSASHRRTTPSTCRDSKGTIVATPPSIADGARRQSGRQGTLCTLERVTVAHCALPFARSLVARGGVCLWQPEP